MQRSLDTTSISSSTTSFGDREGVVGLIEGRLLAAHDDRQKLELIGRFAEEILPANPSYGIALASEGYRIATRIRDYEASASLLTLRGNAARTLGNYQEGVEDLIEAYVLFVDLQRFTDAARAASGVAGGYAALGDHRSALDWYQRGLDHAGEADPLLRADVLDAAIAIRTELGDYPRAFEMGLESLGLRELARDGVGMARSLAATALVHERMGDAHAAGQALARSAGLFREAGDRTGEVMVLERWAELALTHASPEEAMEHALRAATIYEALDNRSGMSRALGTMAAVHEKLGEPDRGLPLAMRAYALIDDTTDDARRVALLHTMGRLHILHAAYDDALFLFDQALRIAEAIDAPGPRLEIHRSISECHERLGRADRALEHHKLFAELRDQLAGREKQRAMAELQVRFDLEKAERERERYRLHAQQLEAEMRLKQNELTTMALHLVQKKELLDQVKEQLATMKENNAGGQMVVEKMIGEIDTTRNADADWKLFEQQLDHLHQDFVRTLSERFGTLTPAELKVCSLARINLSTKDIANLLYTSTRTIDAHKYNIRRKLGLDSKTSLTTFLAGL